MKLVQIVRPINTPPDLATTGECFQVLADFESVNDALDGITSDKYGDGPFDIMTVNRQGVKLQSVTEKVLDTGKAFGPKSGGRPTKPPAPPPASAAKGNDKAAAKTTAK